MQTFVIQLQFLGSNTPMLMICSSPYKLVVKNIVILPLTGFRILDEPLPVIGDTTQVKLVVEDTVAPLSAAIDRRRAPLPAAGTGVNGGAIRDHFGGVKRDRLAAAGLSP